MVWRLMLQTAQMKQEKAKSRFPAACMPSAEGVFTRILQSLAILTVFVLFPWSGTSIYINRVSDESELVLISRSPVPSKTNLYDTVVPENSLALPARRTVPAPEKWRFTVDVPVTLFVKYPKFDNDSGFAELFSM